MNMNETSQALYLKCKIDYMSMILGIFNVVHSCHFRREHKADHNFLSYPLIISGRLNRKGDKFIIRKNDCNLLLFVEIKEMIITDYFSQINFHVYKSIPATFEYDIIIDVNYENSDECVLFSTFTYDKQIHLSEKSKIQELNERKFMFKTIERSFLNKEYFKFVNIYLLINCNIDLLWSVLLNMKLIHKYSKLIADEIQYEGNLITKDIKIKLNKIKKSSNIIYDAVVTKCKLSPKEADIEIVIDSINNSFNEKKNRFDENKYYFKIYEYENKCTIHIFFFFKNSLSFNQKQLFSFKKDLELKKLKDIIEHYNENLGKKIDVYSSDTSSSDNTNIFIDNKKK